MTLLLEFLAKPWPWYVAGPIITLVMFLLLYFGGEFGVSSNLRTMCRMAGGNKFADFFDIDWKHQAWNLIFVVGAILGGFLALTYLNNPHAIDLNPATVAQLESMGIQNPGKDYLPAEIFGIEQMLTVKGFLILLGGGILVGFGARYAGGCTSGHAISGLSNLQVPSLIAVMGFFIGGLLMTHFFLPIIL